MRSFNKASRDPASQPPPSTGEVRAELHRILSNPSFQASQRRRAFLRFIVEETLAGRVDRLKGFTVAVAIFSRDETFDSQADPVVRIEARRLRRDLDSYYVDAGSHDRVRISIPKGSYAPHFEWHEAASLALSEAEQAAGSGHIPASDGSGTADDISKIARAPTRNLIVAALVVALVAAGIGAWFMTAETPQSLTGSHKYGPAVVVLPFKALDSSDNSRYLASGISQELVRNLMRFPSFRLYTLPIGFASSEGRAPAKLGRDLGVAYVVSGSVNSDPTQVHLVTQLSDATTGEVLWSETYSRPLTPEALIGVQRELAGKIATVIGPPYGVVNNDLKARVATADVSSTESYICVLRAYVYRRNFSRMKSDSVLQCLQAAVRRDPNYSDAWAMLGWLYLDQGRFGGFGKERLQEEYHKALQAADRAIKLAPDNTLALKALSSIYHYMGRYDESERLARKAEDLNPNDPDTLAQLGWRLAVRGKFEEGIPILKRAIERTANPPGWYFHLITIDLYLKGNYGQMLQVAQRSTTGGLGVSQLLVAIAAGALGKRELAQQALDKMSTYAQLSHDPTAYLRRHGATDDIVNALMNGLQKARQVARGS